MKNSEQPINANSEWNGCENVILQGLTKREYFAGLVLQGLMANNREEVMTQNEEQLAKWAINHADELLKQLEL